MVNVGRMCLDQSTMLPATPWGVWEIIKRTGNHSDHLLPLRVKMLLMNLKDSQFSFLPGIPTFGKNVLVAGRSKNVGMPIAMLLHTDGRHERPGGRTGCVCTHCWVIKLKRVHPYHLCSLWQVTLR